MEKSLSWENAHTLMVELRALARGLLAGEGSTASVAAEAITPEALARLKAQGHDWDEVSWANRKSFFAAAYKAMWQALIDHARNSPRKRYPEQREEVLPENFMERVKEHPEQGEVLALALERLGENHPLWTEVAEHRYLSGYTLQETAQVMEISEQAAHRCWEQARLCLQDEIRVILNQREASEGEDASEQEPGSDSQETRLTPELRQWALDQFSEEDFAAGFRDIRENGGLTFEDFVEKLEQAAGSDERSDRQ
jgi:RNA polymerase sigma factor (sigma-70 family)